MRDKEILGAIYTLRLSGASSTLYNIAQKVGIPPAELKGNLGKMQAEGLLQKRRQEFTISEKGRNKFRVVMIGGAFEIIHPGHVHTIREAKKLGDLLVVVVATDSTVMKNKERNPVTQQRLRVELVSSIRFVDVAVLGGEGSIYDTLLRVRPDIVALGYDQRHNEQEIEKEAIKRGLHVSVVRLRTPIPSVKTSRIVENFV